MSKKATAEKVVPINKGSTVEDIVNFINDNGEYKTRGTTTTYTVDANKDLPLPPGLTKKAFGLATDHINNIEEATAEYTAKRWHQRNSDKINVVATNTTIGDYSISSRVHLNKDDEPVMTMRRMSMGAAGSSEWLKNIMEVTK